METAISPKLKPGKKIHYPIVHDECCVHANDQCSNVWMREGDITSATKGKGRGSRRKAPVQLKSKPADHRTLDRTNIWIPPPPPAPFTSYQLHSFNARQIIYPGANHDPWWDMPQLIAQVGIQYNLFSRPNTLSNFLRSCTLTGLGSLFLIAPQPTKLMLMTPLWLIK